MGTQQILLIVLSVIIVGVAVVVGILMFNNQGYNSNKQAVASDLTTYGSLVIQWWKTPSAQGGAGQRVTNLDVARIAPYIGFNEANNSLTNPDVGEFRVTAATQADTTVTLVGLGRDEKKGLHPKVTTMVYLSSCTLQATTTDAAAF